MGHSKDPAAWYAWYKRSGRRQLRDLLMREWDPIGISDEPEATGEYDRYLDVVADRLRRGVTAAELADHLERLRTDEMGLDPEPSTDLGASDMLVAWYAENAPDAP